MPGSIKRIFAVFILIAMLPIAYVSYELMSLNKNEKIISEIYQNQLDAILFSVNQYSSDLMISWATQLSSALLNTGTKEIAQNEKLSQIINQTSAIRYVFFSDQKEHFILNTDDQKEGSNVLPQLMSLQQGHSDLISRLIQYKSAGYQRMEVLDSISINGLLPILFALDSGKYIYEFGVILLDQEEMIKSVLSPRMQSISADKFIISARRLKDDSLIYATELLPNKAIVGTEHRENWQQRDFWLLPDYYLGISLKGATMNEVLSERRINTFIILAVIMIMLISGIAFLFLNIKRELYLSNAKSEFVSNVSHEIRTPLSLISMFAETLEMGRVKSEEKKNEYYSIIRKETSRLTDLVNRILSFSQMNADKRIYQFEPINLNAICMEIVSKYSFKLKESGFDFQERYDEKLPSIKGDSTAVNEAIINILDNAIKYSLETKKIEMTTGFNDRNIYVEIKDDGIGISKVHHKEVFDQFFRTPSNDIHNTKGTGLGLSIVKKILDAHHGHVDLKSELGEGSTFRLIFPIET